MICAAAQRPHADPGPAADQARPLPAPRVGAELRVQRDLAVFAALVIADDQVALAGGGAGRASPPSCAPVSTLTLVGSTAQVRVISVTAQGWILGGMYFAPGLVLPSGP
jgi:hypothetical protein